MEFPGDNHRLGPDRSEHVNRGSDVSRFVTYSAPASDKRRVLTGLLKDLAGAPVLSELWA